jgi:hypothetical protein
MAAVSGSVFSAFSDLRASRVYSRLVVQYYSVLAVVAAEDLHVQQHYHYIIHPTWSRQASLCML